LEDFLKVLDENPAALYEFISYFTKYQTNMMSLISKDKEQDKKKVSKKK
jgi:prephenate dehydratase